jgi:hypothetical protein
MATLWWDIRIREEAWVLRWVQPASLALLKVCGVQCRMSPTRKSEKIYCRNLSDRLMQCKRL